MTLPQDPKLRAMLLQVLNELFSRPVYEFSPTALRKREELRPTLALLRSTNTTLH